MKIQRNTRFYNTLKKEHTWLCSNIVSTGALASQRIPNNTTETIRETKNCYKTLKHRLLLQNFRAGAHWVTRQSNGPRLSRSIVNTQRERETASIVFHCISAHRPSSPSRSQSTLCLASLTSTTKYHPVAEVTTSTTK